MNDAKYIGLDVHQATISAAVRANGLGKSPKPVFAGGRNSITSNSTRCVSYTNKPRKSCWPKAGSTKP